MAVKWAVANGNWNAGATWNDGIVPADGDEVYLNGFVVTLNTNITQLNTTISNESNGNIVAGGYINLTTNNMVVTFKEIFTSSIYCVGISGNITCTLTANVYGPSIFNSNATNCAIYSTTSGNTKAITINGNVDNREGFTFGATPSQSYLQITVNGNVSVKNGFIVNVYSGKNYTINGNLTTVNNNMFFTGTQYATMNLAISGNITGGMNFKMSALNGTFYIGGNYHYTGDFNINLSHNVIFASPTAEIKYIGPEPNPNYYVILAQQEMNNRQQYPPENEVKEGTEYVWGEKVGTYQQPPESVVLKDYVYDNGERIGTLENEVTVNVGCTNPQDVRKDVPLANMGTVGTMVIPSRENVLEGTIYDNGTEGTLESQLTADYPAEDKVLIGTSYDHDNMTGTLEPGGDNPQESDVRFGVPYNHNLNTGKAHIPSSQDVRKNVPVEDTVGQIVIPRASEVKKDVEFDIDSVGTMESTVQTNNTINVYRKR